MRRKIPQNGARFFMVWLIVLSTLPTVSWGGTIAVPSIFVLNRPLNPALITRTTGSGLAYGGGWGNRDLFNSAPSNCELKGYSSCTPDKSDSRLVYTDWNQWVYFQLEHVALIKRESDQQQTYSINFNQAEYDAILSIGLDIGGVLSLGAFYKESELRLREYFQDINGGFQSVHEAETATPGYGLHFHLGDIFHLAFYQDGPISPKASDTKGRDFELPNTEGFSGAGLGFRINLGGPEERPDEFNIEIFQLTTVSPLTGDPAALTGVDVEISLFSIVFYSLILRDMHNNYFSGELLRDTDISFANGIGYNGEWVQILVGRDSRYFTGVDGGAQLVLGFQF